MANMYLIDLLSRFNFINNKVNRYHDKVKELDDNITKIEDETNNQLEQSVAIKGEEGDQKMSAYAKYLDSVEAYAEELNDQIKKLNEYINVKLRHKAQPNNVSFSRYDYFKEPIDNTEFLKQLHDDISNEINDYIYTNRGSGIVGIGVKLLNSLGSNSEKEQSIYSKIYASYAFKEGLHSHFKKLYDEMFNSEEDYLTRITNEIKKSADEKVDSLHNEFNIWESGWCNDIISCLNDTLPKLYLEELVDFFINQIKAHHLFQVQK